MRNILYCLLILCLSSCVHLEPVDSMGGDQYISFLPYTEATRGVLLDEFPDGGNYGVLGYCRVKGQSGTVPWETKKVLAVPDIFYNESVRYDESMGMSVYDTPMPWSDEVNDKYTFFAYYPYESVGSDGQGNRFSISAKDEVGAPKFTYHLPYTSQSISSLLDASKMVDAMIAISMDHQQKEGAVMFSFMHMLTSIDFAANNYDPNTSVIISEVSLKGTFAQSMQVDMDDLSYTTLGQFQGTFNCLKKRQTIEPNSGSGREYIVMPHPLILVPEKKGVTNKYTLVIKAKRGKHGKFKTHTIPLSRYSFQPGLRNTVSVSFIGDQCTVSVSTSTSWETGISPDDDIIFD